jgi:hypothetical protein
VVAEPEDAHHSSGHIEPWAPRAHLTQCANVLIAAEYIVLGEHESESRDSLEEPQYFCTAPIVACHGVLAGKVPNHVWIDEI